MANVTILEGCVCCKQLYSTWTKNKSRTSTINGWIVRRNLNIQPKPIFDIKVSHEKLAQTDQVHNENSLYDPRAPIDRGTNMHSLSKIYENLSECAPSGFFYVS